MDIITRGSVSEIICIGYSRGDYFLEGIRQAAKEHDIQHGVVISGMGTFDITRLHYTTRTDLPPHDEFITIEGALELTSVHGMIIDGQPHLHCTVGNQERSWAAHLEDGCRVLYLAEVAIARLDGIAMQRTTVEHGIKELHKA